MKRVEFLMKNIVLKARMPGITEERR